MLDKPLYFGPLIAFGSFVHLCVAKALSHSII